MRVHHTMFDSRVHYWHLSRDKSRWVWNDSCAAATSGRAAAAGSPGGVGWLWGGAGFPWGLNQSEVGMRLHQLTFFWDIALMALIALHSEGTLFA